jgi:hypothetical protein
MLDARYSILDTRFSILDTQCSILILRVAKKHFLAARIGRDVCKIRIEIALDCMGGCTYSCTAIALSFVVVEIYPVCNGF